MSKLQALINAAEQYRIMVEEGKAGDPETVEYFDSVFEEALAEPE